MPDSIYKQCLDLVKRGVNIVNPGNYELVTDEVQIRKLNPADMEDWHDVVMVGGITVRFQDDLIEGTGNNEKDMWGYPCHICMVKGRRSEMAEETDPVLQFRQAVKRYFNHKRRMDAVRDSGTLQVVSTVRDGPKPPPQVVGDYNVYTLTVICWFLEPRTAA